MTHQDLIAYYSNAGMDYEAWSRGFNMHFGYWRRGVPFWKLERMLEEMNERVLEGLNVEDSGSEAILDMGCGLGATLRHAKRTRPNLELTGITLVPWQLGEARKRSEGMNIHFQEADYTATEFPDQSFDGAYALESSCHDAGLHKEGFIREAARLIRPGGRLVVMDGFLKKTTPMHPLYRFAHDHACRYWAMETFAGLTGFCETLEANGFRIVDRTEESWRIAPSVMFVPVVTLRYFLQKLFHPREKVTKESWRHVGACLLSPLLGLARKRFGYYRIVAERVV